MVVPRDCTKDKKTEYKQKPRDTSSAAGETHGPAAVPARTALSAAGTSAALGGGAVSAGTSRALCADKSEVSERSQALSQPCSSPLPASMRLCVCLLHQADIQGHDHVLIIPLYVLSGTGQAHSGSTKDAER